MKKRIIFKILICLFLCSFYLCLISCYVKSGYDVSKKLEAKETDLDGKYVINGLGFIKNEGKPSIDLFQKRGSSELKEVCFYLHKKYQPKEKDVDVEIINSVYKVKDNDNILKFTEVKKSQELMVIIFITIQQHTEHIMHQKCS